MSARPLHQAGSAFPRIPGSTIERARLLRRLDTLSPLTLISGLPGSGKTTLAASWARSRQGQDRVIWLNPKTCSSSRYVDQALYSLFAEACDERVLLIIDDADQHLDDALSKRLCELLQDRPNVHLVVCTRMLHPIRSTAEQFGLASVSLTGKDLNASAEELGDFVSSWGHRPSDEQLHVLYDHMGGWLGPTRAALDGAHPIHDQNGLLSATGFLRDNVLPAVAEHALLPVAMTLSLAEDITEELARAVLIDRPYEPSLLTSSNPIAALEPLERQGLLERFASPLDDLWRFPRLVRRLLRAMFAKHHPEAAAHTHRVLAHRLASSSEAESAARAVRYARLGRDWALLDRLWSEQGLALATDYPDATTAAYRDLPDEVLSTHPALVLASSVVRSLSAGSVTDVRRFADAGWAQHASAAAPTSRLADTLSLTGWIIAERTTGNAGRVAPVVDAHDTYLVHRGDVSVSTRAWFELNAGMAAFADAQTASAIRMLARAARTAELGKVDWIFAAASSQLALVHALLGHTNEAVGHLAARRRNDARWLSSTTDIASAAAEGLLGIDRLNPNAIADLRKVGASTDPAEEWAILTWAATQHALLFGDPVAMLAEVQLAASFHGHPARSNRLARWLIDRCVAELLLAIGELNRAGNHLEGSRPPGALAVPRARLALISGDFPLARDHAAATAWKPGTPPRDRVELLMIKAAAAMAMQDHHDARREFSRAQNLARHLGTLVPHAHLPRHTLVDLLALAERNLEDSEWAALEACKTVYPTYGQLVHLTPRERVILNAMARYETLAEVADAQTVSLNTVKKQASSVYAKLGVHDRKSALLKARRLGLISSSDS